MSLISTADIRAWLSLEEGDEKPNLNLDAVSRAVEDFVDSFTMRNLEAKRYLTDPQFSYFDGTGEKWFYLPFYPVSYISSIHIDGEREFGSGTLLASADFFWYPQHGKVYSEASFFTRGRRNIRVDFNAGYAPVVGNTHNNAVSTYPLPLDLKQVMLEMSVEAFKEGVTAIHTVESQKTGDVRFLQMLGKNSFWTTVLVKYRALSNMFSGR